MNMENTRRYVAGYRNVVITDDYGIYMYVGDIVEIHVMPFDYKIRGELIFSEERCAFFIDCDYGEYDLSHHNEFQDMGATIEVTKIFKRVAEANE